MTIEVSRLEIGVGAPLATSLEQSGLPVEPTTTRAGRRWLRSGGAQERSLLIAGQDGGPVGAGLLVRRPGTASTTLNGCWAPGGREVVDALVEAAQAASWAAGSLLLKVAVDAEDDLTAQVLGARGFAELPTPSVPSPYPHERRDVPRGFVLARDGMPVPTMGYMRQTTDFTCGPVAVGMGMAHLGLAPALDQAAEIGLWREATLIGACDPYGLALATVSRSVPTRVVISTLGPILLEDVTQDPSTSRLRTAIQADFAARAAQAGAVVEHRRLAVDEIGPLVDAGAVVAVLIDQSPMHADADPHWIVVHGRLGEVLLANDPWTDEHLGETWVDGSGLAIPLDLMDRLAGYGDPAYRAVVVLG